MLPFSERKEESQTTLAERFSIFRQPRCSQCQANVAQPQEGRKIREFQRKLLANDLQQMWFSCHEQLLHYSDNEVRCTVLGSAPIKENTRDQRHGMSSVFRAFSSVPRVYLEVATSACLKHTSDQKMLVQFLTSACLRHSSKLELCLCIRHKRMTETLFRREHACAIPHKRMFETLFKIGALLVHSPQAHDRNTLQKNVRLRC